MLKVNLLLKADRSQFRNNTLHRYWNWKKY